MASNGLNNKAKKGTCRMCLRVRNTDSQVKAVGEVSHGFATGHIWECIDEEECESVATKKMEDEKTGQLKRGMLEQAEEIGRYKHYKYFS